MFHNDSVLLYCPQGLYILSIYIVPRVYIIILSPGSIYIIVPRVYIYCPQGILMLYILYPGCIYYIVPRVY